MEGKRMVCGCSLLLFVLLVQISLRHGNGWVDTIQQGRLLRDGETLVSTGGVFQLGFFSPNDRNDSRYLGIWYKQVTVKTVVWVSNREKPLSSTTGVLSIADGGHLVIFDTRVGVFHTLFFSPSHSNSSSASLLDNGNFILRNDVGKVVWQSFDDPTDTFLPGMRLGMDKQTGRRWSLVSWTSADDPSAGTYSLLFHPDEMQFLIQFKDGTTYWSSGLWNGQIFSLVPEMRTTYVFNYSFFSSENMRYFTYDVYYSDILSRLVMGSNGVIQQQTWLKEEKHWVTFWSQPYDACDVYNVCGANAHCIVSATTLCNCPQGFEPDRFRYNQSIRWSPSCVRSRNLTCGDGDGFLEIATVRFPDRSKYEGGSSLRDCEFRCRSDCSCTAFASAYLNGTGGCLFWRGDLIGIRDSPYNAFDNVSTIGRNIYVRVAASDLGSDKRRIHIIIAVIAPLVVIFISCILCYLLKRRKLKSKGEVEASNLSPFESSNNLNEAKKSVDASNLRHNGRSHHLPFFSFSSVEAATDNFSVANKLGQGGFGPVYKGQLADRRDIAVKRLSKNSGQGLEEFKNEVMVISKLQHRNLVRLLGWCVHGEEKILIYEYMPNKSLDSFLFDQTKKSMLDWGKRIQVIEGIAQGLLYLHQYSRITVIHRDLKASNILLDSSMNPKISDFGMARIFGGEQSQANTNRVVGTYGYMSPEYAMEGIFSVKSDVFSFGVLLVEIVSGKKNASAHYFVGYLNLLGYAWELWTSGRILEVVDPMLLNSVPNHELSRYIHVALLCVQNSPIDRPTMSEVVHMLTNKTATMGMPKQPAFSIQRVEAETFPRKPMTCSVNDVTITEMSKGR